MCRVSSRIRGEEIAAYLGAKLNPIDGFEDDTCIYVKPTNLNHISDGDYVDVLDDLYATEQLKKRPGIKVIAMSTPHMEYLRSILQNEIIYIPHHHLNFERAKRERTDIIRCGFIGANSIYNKHPNARAAKALEKMGMSFTPLYNFQTREDSVNYLKQIDIQIIPQFDFYQDVPYYHQTKIVNAMSYGIPTIAGPKLGYRDVEDFYFQAHNLLELVSVVEKLKDTTFYNELPDRLIQEAEKYHIENIAKLYEQL